MTEVQTCALPICERNSAKFAELLDTSIKWTRAVKKDLQRGVRYQFDAERIVEALYRPFVKRWLYYSPQLNEMPNRTPKIFADGTARNRCLVFTDPTAQKPWMACSVDRLPDMHFVGAAAGTVCVPLERYGA